ncbi:MULTISPECIES: hypothetical protein [Pontibacillus]|uniref:Uncharacterized protein n=1 Tax=Pontibacillus chungwhensis TaxID=265426 RepID=A0ABY8UYB3_9BACI|nr:MULTISPECIES: hypothetical protein [Pontibacillus]MCD5325537.1 hypothetical protein [Pontibacillus sp. HN14]WIF98646.1 hypothetical protein QNI29_02970 [Pontibacillus chungwhensis]
MEQFGDLSFYRRECIDATKVFDYVIVSLPGTDTVTSAVGDLTLNPTTADLCTLLDPTTDNRVRNVRTEILPDASTCGEVDPQSRVDETVEIDGETVTLQWVTIEKDTVTFRFSFDVVDPNGCVLVNVCGTSVIDNIEPEDVLLCAPEGTNVDCMLLPSSTVRPYNFTCGGTADTLTFSVNYNLCQAIQSNDEVKLEVIARLCEPRPLINPIETCEPVTPQQCPVIFPGPRNNG